MSGQLDLFAPPPDPREERARHLHTARVMLVQARHFRLANSNRDSRDFAHWLFNAACRHTRAAIKQG